MAGYLQGGPFYRDSTRPFAQRHEGMSLDTIKPSDVPQGKVMFPKDESLSLKTQDIQKAQPTYEHLNYLNKPDFSVGCTDPTHAGGQARTYYASMDRRPRDLSLTTADIERAQPKGASTKGNRHTDPVCPNYELPSSYVREPTPPRFNGRHTNDISDIEHSAPRVRHPQRNYVRDPNEAHDIEFASANYQERHPRHPPRSRADRQLDVKDITETRRLPARETNPLEPVYKVPTHRVTTSLHARYSEEQYHGIELPSREAEEVGEISGSKPRQLHWDNHEPQLSLMREDIPGTVPQRYVGIVPHSIYAAPEVRPMISFHDPHDIPGAHVGSLRRGLATKRSVNPLNPAYTMLEGDGRQQPAPVIEAERGSAQHLHPSMRARANAASLPDLHGGSAAPSRGSGGSSAHSSQRSMQRDASAGTLRRGAQEALDGYSQRPSRTPSGTALQIEVDDTLRSPYETGWHTASSRRSVASRSVASTPSGTEQYSV